MKLIYPSAAILIKMRRGSHKENAIFLPSFFFYLAPRGFRVLARDSDFQGNSMRVMKPVSWRMNAAAKDEG